MKSQNHRRSPVGTEGSLLWGYNAKVLNAPIDLADEGSAMHLIRASNRPFDFNSIEQIRLRCGQSGCAFNLDRYIKFANLQRFIRIGVGC